MLPIFKKLFQINCLKAQIKKMELKINRSAVIKTYIKIKRFEESYENQPLTVNTTYSPQICCEKCVTYYNANLHANLSLGKIMGTH